MNRLVYYAGLYATSAGVLKLVGFVLFIWLARTLSVDDYASFGLLYSLQTGVAAFAVAGVIETAVGELAEHRSPADRHALYIRSITLFMLLATVVCALSAAVFLSVHEKSDITASILIVVLATGVASAFASLQAQITRLEEQHLTSLAYGFLAPLASIVGSFVAFYIWKSVGSVFIGALAGASGSVVICRAFGLGVFGTDFNVSRILGLCKRISPFIVITFLGWVSSYGNNYVISILLEPADVARFTFVLTLSSIMQLIASSLNMVWAPRFYRITHEQPVGEVEKQNRKFFRWQGLALGAVGAVFIAAFPAVVSVLGGNLIAYRAMNAELCLLFSAYVLLSPWWHCHNYFLAYGKGIELRNVTVLTSAIGIAIWIVAMTTLGSSGIYVGFLIQMLLRSVAITYVAKKLWPITISWEGVVAGLAMTSAGFAISELWQ